MDAFDLVNSRERFKEARATSIEVDLEVESLHKRTIKPIVTKLLSVYTTVLIIFSFSVTWQWFGVLLVACATAVFNISRDSKPLDLRFLGIQKVFSMDASDATRWIINISLADASLTFLLGLSNAALAGFWSLVCISVIAETHNPRFRYPVFAYALVVSTACIYALDPNIPLKELIFWFVNHITIGAFFVSLEDYWKKAIIEKLENKKLLDETIRRSDELYRNASVAQHARVIAHEVANLAMGVDLITHNLKDSEQWGGVKASVGYLQRVTRLVLDDLGEEPTMQICSVETLISDVNTVLARQITRKGIRWRLVKDQRCLSSTFVERSGSTYLIIQNLVKNAAEAIQRRYVNLSDGVITLDISFKDGKAFFTVDDNGHGLSEETMRKIKIGAAESGHENGHGLGLRFVYAECRKNGFDFIVGNNATNGASIGIAIKVQSSAIS